MQFYDIVTDDTLRETKEHGSAEFPFAHYYDNFREFSNSYVEWHWHKEFEFVTADSCPVDCLIGNERIQIQKDESLFVGSGVIHRFEASPEGTMPNILFSPEFLAPNQSLIYKKYVAPMLSSGCTYMLFNESTGWQAKMRDWLKKIYEMAESKDEMKEIRIHTMVCDMWTCFFENTEERLVPSDTKGSVLTHSRLQLMMQFISERYPDKIMLEDIADAANISKSEALRCFRCGVCTTPVNYLNKYRLERAAELLMSTKSTVTDIALAAGFESTGYFCRIFRKTFGITPGEFRLQWSRK